MRRSCQRLVIGLSLGLLMILCVNAPVWPYIDPGKGRASCVLSYTNYSGEFFVITVEGAGQMFDAAALNKKTNPQPTCFFHKYGDPSTTTTQWTFVKARAHPSKDRVTLYFTVQKGRSSTTPSAQADQPIATTRSGLRDNSGGSGDVNITVPSTTSANPPPTSYPVEEVTDP